MQEYEILGLSENEYKVYNLLLEKGELSQTNIAKNIEVSKTTAKTICDGLLAKGWIKALDLGERFLYKVNDPELVKVTNIGLLNDTFSQLQNKYKKKYILPDVRIIDNKADLEKMRKDFEQRASEIHILGNADIIDESKDKKTNLKRPGFKNKKWNFIYTSKTGNKKIEKVNTTDIIKQIKDEENSIKSYLEVWEDVVYMAPSVKNNMAVYIKNKDMSDAIRFLMKHVLKNGR